MPPTSSAHGQVGRAGRRTVLLTGFEPFGRVTRNPSQQIAEQLDGVTVSGLTVVGRTLPVVFGRDTALLAALIRRFAPVAVLSLGVDAAADRVRVETVARNRRTAARRRRIPIAAGAPARLRATLPARAMARVLRAAGLPVELSANAGDYLCNHTLFQSLRLARTLKEHFLAGFIHVPLPKEWGGLAGSVCTSARLERGVRRAIAAVAGALSARERANRR